MTPTLPPTTGPTPSRTELLCGLMIGATVAVYLPVDRLGEGLSGPDGGITPRRALGWGQTCSAPFCSPSWS